MNGELLQETDVRSMVRLLGEVAANPGDFSAKRIHLMGGLTELTGSDSWIWTSMGDLDLSKAPAHTIFLNGGFSAEEFVAYLKTQEHPDMSWMTAPFLQLFEDARGQVTRLEQQIVSEQPPQEVAPDLIALMQQANIGPVVFSGRPTSSGQLSVICLFRNLGKPPFDKRESRIAHIILSEVAWLHERSWPDHPRSGISSLSPRLRTVLTLLLEGHGRKEVAHNLALSVETVHGYVKDIYRAFGVQSQTELMHRFMRGDGGDAP